ncbi:MAG TPA: efflux RND transporter periplasmic adaptor subunit [Burkholderiales bacterium]|nr:efflux RND transporter periplasmic adaptor subunit [Burkholderiales bacterium]
MRDSGVNRHRRQRLRAGIGLASAALSFAASALAAGPVQNAPADAAPQPVTVVTVESERVQRNIALPGELRAYQEVAVYPKVQGFVEEIPVDRGSFVRPGQLLVRLVAPEIVSQQRQAEAAAQQAHAQMLEAQSKLDADGVTYRRLRTTYEQYPGAVVENDLDLAEKSVEADKARVKALADSERAAQDFARSLRAIEGYLYVTSPFRGVIIERNAHRGTLAGPTPGPLNPPMLRLHQIDPLRLVIPVPEQDVGAMKPGARIRFKVAAFPGRTFDGELRRIAHALDTRTRTMPVELDVRNANGALAPGMYAEVEWPVSRAEPSLMVPPSAVATTTEKTFVVRIRNGIAEWVEVTRGLALPGKVEVFGDLHAGDQVALRGTDELRPGTRVIPRGTQAR